jgi:hypothetical protein
VTITSSETVGAQYGAWPRAPSRPTAEGSKARDRVVLALWKARDRALPTQRRTGYCVPGATALVRERERERERERGREREERERDERHAATGQER